MQICIHNLEQNNKRNEGKKRLEDFERMIVIYTFKLRFLIYYLNLRLAQFIEEFTKRKLNIYL